MLQFVLGIGIAYFFLKEGSRTTSDQDEEPETSPEEEPTPQPEPTPEPMDFTRFASWSGEYTAGENVVWLYQAGIRFEDGSEEMDSSSYVVIGNSNHTAFLRSNSNRGTIDIPKELTGGSTDQKNVQVFSSIEQASARADELADDTPPDRDWETPYG